MRCAQLCSQFPDEYFRKVDEQKRGYPEAFVDALTEAGWLAAMIPEEYGGSGSRPDRGHGDHGGDQPLRRQLRRGARPDVQHGHAAASRRQGAEGASTCRGIAAASCASSRWRVTEPTTGTDTTKIKTTAVKQGDRYVVNGQKVWISRMQHSDLMILLARTTPLPDVKKKSEGMSIFFVDLHAGDRQRARRCGRSATWSTTRPTRCSSTTSRSRRRT